MKRHPDDEPEDSDDAWAEAPKSRRLPPSVGNQAQLAEEEEPEDDSDLPSLRHPFRRPRRDGRR